MKVRIAFTLLFGMVLLNGPLFAEDIMIRTIVPMTARAHPTADAITIPGLLLATTPAVGVPVWNDLASGGDSLSVEVVADSDKGEQVLVFWVVRAFQAVAFGGMETISCIQYSGSPETFGTVSVNVGTAGLADQSMTGFDVFTPTVRGPQTYTVKIKYSIWTPAAFSGINGRLLVIVL